MWTSEIDAILSSDPATRAVFGGVFASDQLPKKVPEGKRLYVANTDPANKPGQHWVAFYFHPNGVCYYFDSYGLHPLKPAFIKFIKDNAESCDYNARSIQHHKSLVCGFYCIFFGVHMCKGASMTKIISMFTINKRFNDLMVTDFVDHYYGKFKKMNTDTLNQNCCCALESMELNLDSLTFDL